MDLSYTQWHECAIEGGGEKWRLTDPQDGEMVLLATIVHLPGTVYRVFWPNSLRMDDFPSVHEAREYVEARLASEEPEPKPVYVGWANGHDNRTS